MSRPSRPPYLDNSVQYAYQASNRTRKGHNPCVSARECAKGTAVPTSATTPASASFEPLTPTAFLDRSAEVFADRVAVVDGGSSGGQTSGEQTTYAQLRDRCLRQAGALETLGVGPGDRVAVLAPNSRLLLESHYGVPYAGAVLVALNVRLSVDELAYVVGHAGCRVLLHDPSLADVADSGGRGGRPPAAPRRRWRAVRAAAAAGHAAAGARGRRARPAGAELHQRDDRAAQGCDVPPPRRLPAGARDDDALPADQ